MPLSQIRIVLVAPQHPGNIGACARAMKVMGLADLALVAPKRFPAAEATERAAGADDILASAGCVATLDAAIADCRLVIGASARHRRLNWPLVDARSAAAQALAAGGQAALVFGRERSGLTNDELDRCHAHLRIPCNPDYASLNLAAAVQVVCYELRLAAEADIAPAIPAGEPLATAGELEGFYAHLQEVSLASGYLDPAEPKGLMRRYRRLFARAGLHGSEVRVLRGLLRALEARRTQ